MFDSSLSGMFLMEYWMFVCCQVYLKGDTKSCSRSYGERDSYKRNSLNSISLFFWIQSVKPFGVISAICLVGSLALRLHPITFSYNDLSSVSWAKTLLSFAFITNTNRLSSSSGVW